MKERKENDMEQQNVQVEEGISIGDIFKLLLSKVKYLILALLVGCVLGSAFAVWRTYDVKYYGTEVEFYVNPRKDSSTAENSSQYGVYGAYGRHVMDNMTKLLNSESFSEKMLLNGNDLPEKDKWTTAKEQEELGLNAKIDAAAADLAVLKTKKDATAAANFAKTEASLAHSEATLELNQVWREKTGETAFDNKEYVTTYKGHDQELDQAYNDREAAADVLTQRNAELKQAQELQLAAQEKADATTETALSAWRTTEAYQKALEQYKDALSFSFLNKEDEKIENTNDLARSFIYVKISILNDKDFAEEVFKRVTSVVPAYVEANMTVPSGYVGTNCQRITRTDEVKRTNPNYTFNQALKYGVLLGAVALIVACIVIILIDRSDKRLRDTEIITKKFNLPVLGVVPAIEELNDETAKKKTEKTNSTEVK